MCLSYVPSAEVLMSGCPALQYVSKLKAADEAAAALQRERDTAVQVVYHPAWIVSVTARVLMFEALCLCRRAVKLTRLTLRRASTAPRRRLQQYPQNMRSWSQSWLPGVVYGHGHRRKRMAHLSPLVLSCRDSALAECQQRNQNMLEELVSYRAQALESDGTIAVFKEHYRAQACRFDSLSSRFTFVGCLDTNDVEVQCRAAGLYGQYRSLQQHCMRQDVTIVDLRREVSSLKNGWVSTLRLIYTQQQCLCVHRAIQGHI